MKHYRSAGTCRPRELHDIHILELVEHEHVSATDSTFKRVKKCRSLTTSIGKSPCLISRHAEPGACTCTAFSRLDERWSDAKIFTHVNKSKIFIPWKEIIIVRASKDFIVGSVGIVRWQKSCLSPTTRMAKLYFCLILRVLQIQRLFRRKVHVGWYPY